MLYFRPRPPRADSSWLLWSSGESAEEEKCFCFDGKACTPESALHCYGWMCGRQLDRPLDGSWRLERAGETTNRRPEPAGWRVLRFLRTLGRVQCGGSKTPQHISVLEDSWSTQRPSLGCWEMSAKSRGMSPWQYQLIRPAARWQREVLVVREIALEIWKYVCGNDDRVLSWIKIAVWQICSWVAFTLPFPFIFYYIQ